VAQDQATDLNEKILAQAASLKELKAKKKILQQQTGVKARRTGTAAKGKLMPSAAPAQPPDEIPPTAEFAELYTAMHHHEAAYPSPSVQSQLTQPMNPHLGFMELDPELDPDRQGFPSSTAPPSFHYNDSVRFDF